MYGYNHTWPAGQMEELTCSMQDWQKNLRKIFLLRLSKMLTNPGTDVIIYMALIGLFLVSPFLLSGK